MTIRQNVVISARSGQLFDDNNQISGWIDSALRNRTDSNPRTALDAYRRDSIGRAYGAAIADSGRRADAFGGDGFHFARELEHVYGQVLEEKKPVLNAMALFPMDRSVPVGARTHTVRRESIEGEAVIYKAGSGDDTPTVSVSRAEEEFPVRHIVTGFEINMFDEQSSQFANTGLFGRKLAATRKVIERKLNDLYWNGDAASGLRGILDYPWLAKMVSALTYDGSSTATQYLDDLSSAANFAAENSSDVFFPNVLATTSRIKNQLQKMNMGNGTDSSVLEYFLKNQNYVTRVVVANELQGVGPNGEDGLLFYRDDSDSVSNSLIVPYQAMPAERRGFSQRFIAWATTGGTIMRDVGNNLLLFAAAS